MVCEDVTRFIYLIELTRQLEEKTILADKEGIEQENALQQRLEELKILQSTRKKTGMYSLVD